MRSYLFVILSIFLLIGCNKKNSGFCVVKENGTTIMLERTPSVEDPLISLDNFIDSVKYIELELVPESILSRISDVFITDNYIIVIDQSQDIVLFFDKSGKYSHKISRKGKGPGEYTDISHAMIDTKAGEILIYNHDYRRVNYYNYDGTYLRAIDNFSNVAVIRDMINKPDGGFVCYTFDLMNGEECPCGLWEVDSNGKFVKYYQKEEYKYPIIFPYSNFSLYNLPDNKIGFTNYRTSEIGYIDEDLHITQSFELPGKTYSDFKSVESLTEDESLNLFVVFNNIEKGFCRLTEIGTGHSSFWILYDKKGGVAQSSNCIANQFNNSSMLIGRVIPNNTTSVLTTAIYSDFISMIMGHPQEEARNMVKDIVKGRSVDEVSDMNPIIQLIYMKE